MQRIKCENQTWTRGLWRMSTAEEMAEFVLLWERVQEVTFSDQADTITWKWSANGLYSSKSAYGIQFVGSYCTFNSKAIWKAKAEGKHRFFGWLLLQQKIQTADILLVKGIPCNPVCCLCDQAPETAAHLCLHCPFARRECRSRIGGTMLCGSLQHRPSPHLRPFFSTRCGISGMRGIGGSSKGSCKLRYEFLASSSRRWPSGNRRARSEGLPSVVMLLFSMSLSLFKFYVITAIVRTRLLLLLK